MVGSEVYSTEVKKTEVLAEAFRRAIGACPPPVICFLINDIFLKAFESKKQKRSMRVKSRN